MKNLLYPKLAVGFLVTSAGMAINATNYKLKDGHSIAFKSKDPSGEFKKMSGTIKFDETDLAGSKFELSFPIASISTGNGMMNKKAQTSEWFDAGKYPEVKFVSSKIEKSGSDYKVTGKLTMKGVSKTKAIPLKVTKTGNDLTFTGKFSVDRMEFGVGHKSDAVPDVLNIVYSIPVTKK